MSFPGSTNSNPETTGFLAHQSSRFGSGDYEMVGRHLNDLLISVGEIQSYSVEDKNLVSDLIPSWHKKQTEGGFLKKNSMKNLFPIYFSIIY